MSLHSYQGVLFDLTIDSLATDGVDVAGGYD